VRIAGKPERSGQSAGATAAEVFLRNSRRELRLSGVLFMMVGGDEGEMPSGLCGKLAREFEKFLSSTLRVLGAGASRMNN